VRFSLSFGLTLGLLVLANVLAHRVFPEADAAVAVGMTAALVAVAAASRLTLRDLGLARGTWASGARWGAGAAAVVAIGFVVAALIPAVRDAVAPATTGWNETLFRALVVIPLLTVLPEEFAFRGVLWGLLERRSGRVTATAVSSALFGLWHVLAAMGGGAANESVTGVVGGGTGGSVLLVIGTVLFTAAAGVVFGVLRDRSDSLLAPIGLHWAVNGMGELWLQLA
jgi:membrane protease YdiL (CAAX protease family)